MNSEAGFSHNRIAIDVGGTFVDYVRVDGATGEIAVEKQLSTPERIVDEVLTGLSRLSPSLSDVNIFHGTTVALNTIVQERGVKVGLLTTEGFRDVLEIGRGGRPEIYNPHYREPVPLVPRFLRREVRGRMDGAGKEVTPLSIEDVDRECDLLLAEGCEAIAICFLHSFSNNAHENAAAHRIRQRYPDIVLSVSHELVMEWREFERTSTTVLNAYVQPSFRRYVNALSDRLRGEGYVRPLALMQSNGGVSAASRAADRPITTLESGPAGGVIGASVLAAEIGIKNVICSDVGGTTVDLALIEDGALVERNHARIAGRPVLGPTIDIQSAAVGGGTIGWVDERGALRVGPLSAGSSPGPACFGLGGTQPTVTDSHLVLGTLDPERFLGSRIRLDINAAARAIDGLAAQLAITSREEMALGILRIAETNMVNAIRGITVKRGVDPRDFVLLSYGGGGGYFATAVAEELGIRMVVSPNAAAAFSAWGIATSDYREDSTRMIVRRFDPAAAALMGACFAELAEENLRQLEEHGFGPADIAVSLRVDMRFVGQEYTITIPVDQEWIGDPALLFEALSQRFVATHLRLFGHGEQGAPLEVVVLRVRSVGKVSKPAFPCVEKGEAVEPIALRRTFFRARGDYVDTPVFERARLPAGQKIEGPAIIEEWSTTTLVPPGWTGSIDRSGNLLLAR